MDSLGEPLLEPSAPIPSPFHLLTLDTMFTEIPGGCTSEFLPPDPVPCSDTGPAVPRISAAPHPGSAALLPWRLSSSCREWLRQKAGPACLCDSGCDRKLRLLEASLPFP